MASTWTLKDEFDKVAGCKLMQGLDSSQEANSFDFGKL